MTSRAFSAVRLIPIVIGLLVAAVLLPVMTLGYLGARENTGRLLTANRDAMLDGLEQKIRDTLDETSKQMATVAAMIGDGRIDPADETGFSRFMLGVAQGHSSVVSTAYVGREGGIRRWLRDGPGVQLLERNTIPTIDAIWSEIESGRKPYWRQPVLSQLVGAAIIPHIQPVIRQGEIIGVIITVLTSESVSRYIDRMEQGVTPFVLIGLNRVLAHPNIKGSNMISDQLPLLSDVNDPALAVIWADPRPPAQNVPGRSQVHWTWLENSWHAQVYSYRQIADYGGDPWLIGFHRSSLDTFRERWIIQGLFWGSGAMMLLAVGLAFLLGRRAVQPAGEIAAAARALERLDFHAVERPAIVGSRITEVRDTAHALSRASAALKRFQTYVPRALVGQLMAMEETARAASDREVTVMFMDLAGYTAFADGRSASEVGAYLNSIFAEVGPLIEATGGTIDKYTGDGLMAVWGAPVADPDHARAAWGASLRILEHMTPLVAAARKADAMACRIRLGLHTGRVLAGDLGFAGRIDYTVVGRTVNIAQRTQTALKDRMGDAPVGLAITEAFRAAIGLSTEGLSPLPAVKGGAPAHRVVWLTPSATKLLEQAPPSA
jgi:adenylate cyclase